MSTPWPWWRDRVGNEERQTRELLKAVWDLHALYLADEQPWVWRGQANSSHSIEPGMHTRVGRSGPVSDINVRKQTEELLSAARLARVDQRDGLVLPDLALLALLQHHGAATPLLDVSLDPLVALYMAVVSPNAEDDKLDGIVFAIRRPKSELTDFDSRKFGDVYNNLPANVCFYTAPDVSDRLRIQRGHFLLGKHSAVDYRVTLGLSVEPAGSMKETWLWHRLDGRGLVGRPAKATSDVAMFMVPSSLKSGLRSWLEIRSGLTKEFVYPTSWHQPFLDRFAASHGRSAPL
jgi:hypothetical protein